MKKHAFKANLLEKLKSISKREANLFFSLCEDQSEVIKTKRFKEVLLNSGLKSNDNRLYKLFQNLDAHGDKIVFEDFIEIVRTSELLVEKALRGELAIPDFGDFSKNLALDGTISPILASWLRTIIMFPFSIYLTYRATNDRSIF